MNLESHTTLVREVCDALAKRSGFKLTCNCHEGNGKDVHKIRCQPIVGVRFGADGEQEAAITQVLMFAYCAECGVGLTIQPDILLGEDRVRELAGA